MTQSARGYADLIAYLAENPLIHPVQPILPQNTNIQYQDHTGEKRRAWFLKAE